MNRVKNPGFDLGTLADWTKTGTQTAAITQDTTGYNWSNNNGVAHSGVYGCSLGSGVNGIEQTITGLNPNTTYRISAWIRVSSGETASLGAYNYGGSDMYVTQTQSYVSVPNSSTISFGSPSNGFTVAAWIKTGSANNYILSKGRPASGSSHIDYNLSLDANGKLSFFRWHQSPDQSNSVTYTGGSVLNNNAWHHVAFVNESATSHKLYVDGVLMATSTATWSYDDGNTEALEFGRYKNATYGTYYFNGQLDDVRIYKRALTSTEIAALAGM